MIAGVGGTIFAVGAIGAVLIAVTVKVPPSTDAFCRQVNAVRFFASYPPGAADVDEAFAQGAIEQKKLADMADTLSDDDASPLSGDAANYAYAYAQAPSTRGLGVGLRYLRTDCRA